MGKVLVFMGLLFVCFLYHFMIFMGVSADGPRPHGGCEGGPLLPAEGPGGRGGSWASGAADPVVAPGPPPPLWGLGRLRGGLGGGGYKFEWGYILGWGHLSQS